MSSKTKGTFNVLEYMKETVKMNSIDIKGDFKDEIFIASSFKMREDALFLYGNE
jgi:hypothetical protein